MGQPFIQTKDIASAIGTDSACCTALVCDSSPDFLSTCLNLTIAFIA
jgi:hypothetical protein